MKAMHWVATGFLLLSAVAWCDKVLLMNGGQLVGIIEEQDDEQVTLRTDAGRVSLPRSMIETIEISARGMTHLQLGKSFLQSGQLDKAEAEFQRALDEPGSYEQARRYLDGIEQERARVREEEIRRVTTHAQMLVAEELFGEAIAYLTEVLESQYPDAEDLRRQRGEIRLLQAETFINHYKYPQAKTLLVLAHEDGGSSVRLHTLLGMLDRREGRLSDAREEFRLARRAAATEDRGAGTEDIETALAETEALLAGLVPATGLRRSEAGAKVGRNEILSIIKRECGKFEIDPLLVEAVVAAESNFQWDAVSPAGAQGLMQLMPGTASDMGVSDPFDPEQNIRGGTRYLALMLAEFNDTEKALAAYNAGPHKVHIYGGIPPYRETEAFVPKVMERYNRLKETQSSPYPTG